LRAPSISNFQPKTKSNKLSAWTSIIKSNRISNNKSLPKTRRKAQDPSIINQQLLPFLKCLPDASLAVVFSCRKRICRRQISLKNS